MIHNKRKTVGLIVIALIFIIVSLAVYMWALERSVEKSTIETMKELAAHDKISIEGENEYGWESLEQIVERIKIDNPKTIKEICLRLNKEASNDKYDLVAMVDNKGRTYSYTGLIQNGKDTEPVKKILAGEDKFSINCETGNQKIFYRDKLVQGITINPYKIENTTFVGIYSVVEITAYEEKMQLDSFGEDGDTAVFDKDGYYVVKRSMRDTIGDRHNFYSKLGSEYDCTDEEIAKLKAKINKRESFQQILMKKDSTETIIHFEPIDDTDWTMTLSVPITSVSKTARGFARQTFIILLIISVTLVMLMLLIIRQHNIAVNAKAEAAARAEFLANMSHEIRTPLNGIIGLNRLMKLNVENRDKLIDYLEKSESTEKYLLSLINDILDLQKLQAGKIEVINRPFSITKLTGTTEAIIRSRMETQNICFNIVSDVEHDVILGDSVHVEQILMNILGNAAKFTDRNGKVEMRIKQIPVGSTHVKTIWEIEDNGCGMSKEYQKKIFDSFSQERTASKESVKGTGLGMSISAMLSKAMGGELSVQSELGKGSCFRLEVTNEISSLQDADIDGETESDNLLQVEDKTLEPLHILLAEDNELNAEILLELLEINGHNTDLAVDGDDVIKKFSCSEVGYYDLILMDVQMPKKNGYEATKEIRKLDRADAKDVLIFACTANTFQQDVDMAMQAGMNDFIGKPIDVDKLFEKLKKSS